MPQTKPLFYSKVPHHLVPTEAELNWYQETLSNNPQTKPLIDDDWSGLPFPPLWEDPEWYAPLITREQWGAQPSKPGIMEPLKLPLMYVRYTWVGKEECDTVDQCSAFLRKLQETSMAEGLADLPYNFLVGGKGIIFEGRGWDWEADREQKYNELDTMHGPLKGRTLDIAYIGDLSFYAASNAVEMAAFHFVRINLRNEKLHRMVDFIPYKEQIKDFEADDVYYTKEDIPPLRKKDMGNKQDSEITM